MAQLDIFGGVKPAELQTVKITREIMHEKPMTYRSHRLLMKEIARSMGFDWEALDSSQQHILECLFDASPDIERASRKVRQEDSAKASGVTPNRIQATDDSRAPTEEDPFDALNRESREKRRRW